MSLVVCHQYGDTLAASVEPLLPEGVEFRQLGHTPDTAWQVPADAEVLLVNQDSAAVGLHQGMARPQGWPFGLQWVHLRSTGIDKYPGWIFEVPQITVTRGGSAVPIAEYVFAAMLSRVKAVPEIWAQDRDGWRHHKLGELRGQTLGIVGFGEIGRQIAQRALAFGMRVVGVRRSGGSMGMEGVEGSTLADLLPQVDQLVLCAPLTRETQGLIGEEAFAIMKAGAHLINVGRGALVDTEALRVALDGTLGGATLDVTDPEPLPDGHWLFSHPKARVSPHISGSSPFSRKRQNEFLAGNLRRYLAREALEGLVDKEQRY